VTQSDTAVCGVIVHCRQLELERSEASRELEQQTQQLSDMRQQGDVRIHYLWFTTTSSRQAVTLSWRFGGNFWSLFFHWGNV